MLQRIKFIFLFFFLISLSYVMLCERTWLSISVDKNQHREYVYMAYLPSESRFCVLFTHSVALSPVEEWFVAQDGKISLRSTVYEDFGAGLPHNAEPGQEMRVEDGKVIITGYSLTMQDMYVRVGRVANHKLIVEKTPQARNTLQLHTLAPAGTALRFSIRTDSFLHVFWRHWGITVV